MLSELEVREQLRRAADTILVPDAVAPGPAWGSEAPKRWLMPVAAAVAVLLAVLAGTLVVTDRHRPANPAHPAGRVAFPELVGTTEAAARATLLGHGYSVKVVPEPTPRCLTPGRVLRTVVAGDTAELHVSSVVTLGLCPERGAPDAHVWALLDFAAGKAPAPAFASSVFVLTNGDRLNIPGDVAAHRSTWQAPGSALSLFRARLAANTATGALWYGGPTHDLTRCVGREVPSRFSDRVSTRLAIRAAAPAYGCAVLDIYRNAEGAIDGIVVRASAPPTPTAAAHNFAGTVANPDEAGIGMDVLDFAIGRLNRMPTVAPRIQLYLGNRRVRSINSATQARVRSSYALCLPYAGHSCPMSAITTIRHADRTAFRPGVTGRLSPCLDTLAPTLDPVRIGARGYVVVSSTADAPFKVDPAHPAATPRCGATWAVQVFYDDEYRITAINLLFRRSRSGAEGSVGGAP